MGRVLRVLVNIHEAYNLTVIAHHVRTEGNMVAECLSRGQYGGRSNMPRAMFRSRGERGGLHVVKGALCGVLPGEKIEERGSKLLLPLNNELLFISFYNRHVCPENRYAHIVGV